MTNTCDVCTYRSYLFDNLNKTEFGLLTLSRKEMFFRKGEIICREGEKINNFYYLKEGLLKVYKTVDARKEQIIRISNPKDLSGLFIVFSNFN